MSNLRRRLAQALLLLLLPALTGVAAEYGRTIRGPFFAGQNQDPSYRYLLGALRVATQSKTAFIHHPGLTTQGLGAGVVTVTHSLRWSPSRETPSDWAQDLARDVVGHPELYLRAMQLTILMAFLAALVTVGFLAWRGGDPVAALLLQASALLSALGLESLSLVGPESALMLAIVALAATVWRFASVAPNDERAFALAFGAITAFALSTRISAVLFVIVPLLLLRSWRGRLLFGVTAAAAASLALMIVEERSHLLPTFLFHGRRTGDYGAQPRSLFDPNLYGEGIAALFLRHHAFFAVMGLAVAVWIWQWQRRHKAQTLGLYHRALGAVLLGQVVQLLIVSKTPAGRYLLPATALVALDLALVWALVAGGSRQKSDRLRALIAVLLLTLPAALELPRHRAEHERLRRGTAGQRTIAAEISQLPAGCKIVEFYRASSIPYALQFGRHHLPKAASYLLAERYPEQIFYNHYRRTFETYTGTLLASEVASLYPCLALHGHFRPDLAGLLIRQTPIESLYTVPSVDTIIAPSAESR